MSGTRNDAVDRIVETGIYLQTESRRIAREVFEAPFSRTDFRHLNRRLPARCPGEAKHPVYPGRGGSEVCGWRRNYRRTRSQLRQVDVKLRQPRGVLNALAIWRLEVVDSSQRRGGGAQRTHFCCATEQQDRALERTRQGER